MTITPPTHQAIAARAYQLYLERGRQHGHEVDDWLQAEYELLQLPLRTIAELEATDQPPAGKGSPQKRSLIEVVRSAAML